MRYLLSVPDGAPSGPRPVLCFLHGYDEAAPTEIFEGVTRHGPLRPGSDGSAMQQMIVVAPQLPAAGDIWRRYADVVRDIVSRVQAEHGGDPARTYLTGFSFGGNGVFDLALCQPGFWAALWPVDPTRVPGGDPGLPVWMSSGEVSPRGGPVHRAAEPGARRGPAGRPRVRGPGDGPRGHRDARLPGRAHLPLAPQPS
ncbi:MAG TPA: hypothetical protein VGB66_08145 [Longimicrobium sp.]